MLVGNLFYMHSYNFLPRAIKFRMKNFKNMEHINKKLREGQRKKITQQAAACGEYKAIVT